VLVVSVGAMASICLEVADRLVDQGIAVTVVDPRWVTPVDPGACARSPPGTGWSSWSRTVCAAECPAPSRWRCATPGADSVLDFGVPARFLDHGKRGEVLAAIGLTAQGISREVVETVARIDAAVLGSPVASE
jgi:1-deoxy-D-xylulose-5-phosphate synthase